jgi:hypothetical protein
LSGYGFDGKPDGNNWMEYEAEHPQNEILYFPWKYLPQSIIDKVGYERIRSLGGLETYFVNRETSKLKPGEKTNLDMWLELMDWSHLHTLHLTAPSSDTLQKLSGNILPSLQQVAFRQVNTGNSIVNFLANTSSPLKSISLEQVWFCGAPGEIINTIAKHHGTAFQSLKINHRSSSNGIGYRGYRNKPYRYPSNTFINSTHFSHLLFACPNIETLDIDLDTKEEWDYNLTDTIVSFPNLTKLVLHFQGEEADT